MSNTNEITKIINELNARLFNIKANLTNAEDSIENDCDNAKYLINRAAKNAIDLINNLKQEEFDKVDEHKKKCLEMLKKRKTEEQKLNEFVKKTQHQLNKTTKKYKIEELNDIKNAISIHETYTHYYIDCFLRLDYKIQENYEEFKTILGEIKYRTFDSNKLVIDVEKFSKLTSDGYKISITKPNVFNGVKLNKSFEHLDNSFAKVACFKYLPNNYIVFSGDEIMLGNSSSKYKLEFASEIIVHDEKGLFYARKFNKNYKVKMIELLNNDTIVFLMDEKNRKKISSLVITDFKLNLIKSYRSRAKIASISVYNKELYCQLVKNGQILVLTEKLEVKLKINGILPSDRMIIHHGRVYGINEDNKFSVCDLVLGKQVEEIKLNEIEKIFYIDGHERILAMNTEGELCIFEILKERNAYFTLMKIFCCFVKLADVNSDGEVSLLMSI